MSSRHPDAGSTRDAGDEALDALLAAADHDLQDGLGAALDVDAGLTAIVDPPVAPDDVQTPRPHAFGANRGGAGFGGAGAGFGGYGGRDDEEEKQPTYLLEPSPEEVFGTDEMAAPPVIGDQRDDDGA